MLSNQSIYVSIFPAGLFKSCGFSNDQQQSSTDPAEIVILVAEAENAKALVGYTVLMPGYSARSGRTLLMKNMYVRESHRAIGVGSAIFRGIARYGLQHGYAFEENHVFSWNKPAVKFYERMGAEDLSASEGAQYLRVELDQSKK